MAGVIVTEVSLLLPHPLGSIATRMTRHSVILVVMGNPQSAMQGMMRRVVLFVNQALGLKTAVTGR